MKFDWTDPDEWDDPICAERLIQWLVDLVVIDADDEEGIQVDATIAEVLRTAPIHEWFSCGGDEVEVIAQDGRVYIWFEDWLSGCIPKYMSYDTAQAREYTNEATADAIQKLQQELEPDGWQLVQAVYPDGVLYGVSRAVFEGMNPLREDIRDSLVKEMK